jgi:transcriptional regulator with XRE-family HTH domain
MTKKARRALDASIRSANLTVKSIASALGVSQSALRRYRRGSRPVPPKLLKAVAALLRYQAERLSLKATVLDSIAAQQSKREE